YHYTPSLVAAALFTLLFAISTLLHAYQLIRTRTWSFIPLLIGGIFEVIGYTGRVQSHYDTEALGPYIMQTLLLLVAPALFAASIYMILGRLIALLDGEKQSLIRLKWLTKIFVAGDILSFTLQSGGGGIMAGGDQKSMKNGERLVLIGLFVQIIFFGFFIIASIVFHRRINRNPTGVSLSLANSAFSLRTSWMGLLYALYASSAAILIRSVFRAIEYIQGNSGYLMSTEIWIYLFDAVLMLTAMVIF
ncbi:RTA-like protein, partial [Morchella snyderi]